MYYMLAGEMEFSQSERASLAVRRRRYQMTIYLKWRCSVSLFALKTGNEGWHVHIYICTTAHTRPSSIRYRFYLVASLSKLADPAHGASSHTHTDERAMKGASTILRERDTPTIVARILATSDPPLR